MNHTLFFVEGNPAFEHCDAAVLGVAFDENASYGKGAAAAPRAIIQASHQLEVEEPLTGKIISAGIHNFGVIRPKGAREMIRGTEKHAKRALEKGKFFVLLGGDHSVVNGLLGAVPKGACFVNFDAHLDLKEQWIGGKESHAAVSRRIFDKGFRQVWVGVRDFVGEEEMDFVSQKGLSGKIFYCPAMPKEFYAGRKFPKWMRKENVLFNRETSKKQMNAILKEIGKGKVWLNIDVDCLDLREGIETGVPTPFGLSLEQLNAMLFEICRKKKVLGFSLCELVPDRFNRGQTIAAMLCYNILSWALP